MNDALLDIRRTDIFDAEFRRILFQRSKLLGAFWVHYGNTIAIGIHARGRRHVMIRHRQRSEEHTSELQSLMRISYDVFCLTKKKQRITRKGEEEQKRNKSK